jgi:hypothetical protein
MRANEINDLRAIEERHVSAITDTPTAASRGCVSDQRVAVSVNADTFADQAAGLNAAGSS